MGEEYHQIALQEQHKLFLTVINHLRKSKKRQAKYADRGTKEIEYKVDDPVYYKNHRKGKFGMKYLPYYRIIEKKGPVSFVIKNQLDGSTIKAYAGDIRLANIDDWQISKDANNRRLRDVAYVIPPQPSESETESDSYPAENVPLSKLAKKYRQEKETSEDEEDIPLMELRKRLRHREMRQTQNEETRIKDMECNDELSSDNSSSLPLVEYNDSDNGMDVNEVHSPQTFPEKEIQETVKPVKKRQKKSQDKGGDVEELLRLISNML